MFNFLAKKHQKNAETIKVVRKELTVSNIEQYYFDVKPKNKDEVLSRLIDIYNPQLSVIFCNTKRKVDELTEMLKGRGYFAEGLLQFRAELAIFVCEKVGAVLPHIGQFNNCKLGSRRYPRIFSFNDYHRNEEFRL